MKMKIQLAPLLTLLLASMLVLAPLPAAADGPAADEQKAAESEKGPEAESPAEAEAEEPSGEETSGEESSGEETYSNTIRWTTASEVDNFGFDVYRSESEDGPFEVLTEEPVEGAGTVDEPQKYVFVDDTIDPTKAYYYFVESISMSGVRERFTPVARAKPKKP